MSKRRVRRQVKRVPISVYAAILKKRMTKAEILLEGKLRYAAKKIGVEFVSQGILGGRFIGDFVCYDKQLVVEVDGSVHTNPRVRAKDRYRSKILVGMGYKVVRFTNKQVFDNCGNVVKSILSYL